MLSQVLHASFEDSADQRASDRRRLRLDASVAAPAGEGDIRVLNLSRTGMLVECGIDVAVGASIEVELLGGSLHPAEVVWADDTIWGCRFTTPLSQAQLSAALLRSAPESQAPSAPATDARGQHAVLSQLRDQFGSDPAMEPAVPAKLPLQQRMWLILGLGTLGWAAPAAAAWMLFRS